MTSAVCTQVTSSWLPPTTVEETETREALAFQKAVLADLWTEVARVERSVVGVGGTWYEEEQAIRVNRASPMMVALMREIQARQVAANALEEELDELIEGMSLAA